MLWEAFCELDKIQSVSELLSKVKALDAEQQRTVVAIALGESEYQWTWSWVAVELGLDELL